MSTQETATNALAAALGSGAAIVVGAGLAVVLWLGAEWAMDALDLRVPVRQLAMGRSLDALAMAGRWLYWLTTGWLAKARPARSAAG